jgi:hypothetical protein
MMDGAMSIRNPLPLTAACLDIERRNMKHSAAFRHRAEHKRIFLATEAEMLLKTNDEENSEPTQNDMSLKTSGL